MIRLNKPTIRASRDSEKIEELKRYLFTLVDDLQFSMQALENEIKKLKEIEDTQTALKNEIAGLEEEIKKLKEAQS